MIKQKSLVILICLSSLICNLSGRAASFSPTLCEANKNYAATENAAVAPSLKSENSPALQNLLSRAVADTVNKFAGKGLKPDQLAATLIDLRDADKPQQADYRGESKIYPASVVKLFYLAAAHRWLEDGKIKDTPELRRGLRDMIVDSSNDATGYIVDVLSGVGSGAELSDDELKTWAEKRERVERYFESLGYQNINVKQKTFCEDAYGREQQFRGKDGANRNKLTTNATARLLAEIASGKAVNRKRSIEMMDLLKRNWEAKGGGDPEDQAHGFTAIALPPGAKLWSKAGWTSQTRHDAAYVETPDEQKFILVTFTENFANEREIIPNIARLVLAEIGKLKTEN